MAEEHILGASVSSFPFNFSQILPLDNNTPISSFGHWGKIHLYLIVVIGVGALAVLANLRVFAFFSFEIPRSRHRFVHVLIGHQSIVATINTLITALQSLEQAEMTNWMAPGICQCVHFTAWAIRSVFPLNYVAVLREIIKRTRAGPGFVQAFRKLQALQLTSLIWMVSIFCSSPKLFMTSYHFDTVTKKGSCKLVLLLGSWKLTTVYEILRFVSFHVFPVVYSTTAWWIVRSKIREISHYEHILTEQTREKIKRIHYLYLSITLFIIIWLSSGFCLMMNNLPPRIGILFSEQKPIFEGIIQFSQIYQVLNPVAQAFLFGHLTLAQIFSIPFSCPALCKLIGSIRQEQNTSGIEIVESIPIDSIDPTGNGTLIGVNHGNQRQSFKPQPTQAERSSGMSRISTAGISPMPSISSGSLNLMLDLDDMDMDTPMVQGTSFTIPRIEITPPSPSP